MTTTKPDDLEAVRAIAAALDGFEAAEQERILRWAREKVGLVGVPFPTPPQPGQVSATTATAGQQGTTDIKSFIAQKHPQSDNQFAAAVAYYYRFEAPAAERRESITADDLQDATRKSGWERMARPSQTLINAHQQGWLDKTGERGYYSINTVGENLVAMVLPGDGSNSTSPRKRPRRTQPPKTKPGKKAGRR